MTGKKFEKLSLKTIILILNNCNMKKIIKKLLFMDQKTVKVILK